ncbi:MAG: Resolvase helix-turn-helix protein [Parcubacteria group bacterium Gr01-1014_13]|nr:MAG: Resolvase helix-turn-helix protein [Parcubacteria group bacterium Gr01-1014_13]
MPKKTITNKQEFLVKDLYNQGMTGREISIKLKLSLKQIYGSLRRHQIPRKSMWEQNRILFERKPLSFRFKENLSVKERELLIAAIMLYYGEGAKTSVTVDFANSDTRVAKLFLKFLRTICRIDEKRLRLYLYCFSDQDQNALIKYWSLQLNVERNQFTKPYVRSIFNRGKRSMPYGVIHVRYSDKKLLEKILSLCHSLVNTL